MILLSIASDKTISKFDVQPHRFVKNWWKGKYPMVFTGPNEPMFYQTRSFRANRISTLVMNKILSSLR